MNKELEDKLRLFAIVRADNVFDIDIDELRQLVIDGANWMYEQEHKVVECDNCGEMVEMISTGEFCPKCQC